MCKLVVLGSVNADHVLQVDNFPRPGETVLGRNYQVIPGGKGANQAVAAARLGADVAFIACVGNDHFGRKIIEDFRSDGINVNAVIVDEHKPTGIAMIQVSTTGENSIALAPEANENLTPDKVAGHRLLIENADMLLMQLETPIETVTFAAEAAKAAGTKVILNPAPARHLDDSLLAMVDIITPNETEAEYLTGITVCDDTSAQEASNVLHDKGIDLVIITLGEAGIWLSCQGRTAKRIPGFNVKAVDTTAAGDTFSGGFLAALQKGLTLEKAITFANAAAALAVTKEGAQTSIPTLKDVNAYLN